MIGLVGNLECLINNGQYSWNRKRWKEAQLEHQVNYIACDVSNIVNLTLWSNLLPAFPKRDNAGRYLMETIVPKGPEQVEIIYKGGKSSMFGPW